MTDEMRHIGDITGRVAQMIQLKRTERQELIAQHGWPADVECARCGDTGWQPERTTAPCPVCDAGQANAARRKREQAWETACPRRFRGFRLTTHPDTSAMAQVDTWLDGGMARGQNLLLAGPVGTGKTGLAMAALRLIYLRGDQVIHGTSADLLEGMRPPRPGDAPGATGLRDLQRVAVLLIDDLGVEKASEWQAERLYMAINERYERQLPTVMTTNKTRQELIERVGERIVSRLMEDVCVVALTGHDLRGEQRKA